MPTITIQQDGVQVGSIKIPTSDIGHDELPTVTPHPDGGYIVYIAIAADQVIYGPRPAAEAEDDEEATELPT